MKECDILGDVKTYSDPFYYQGDYVPVVTLSQRTACSGLPICFRN